MNLKFNNEMKEPKEEDFGWTNKSFYEKGGWEIEGGEEAYHKKLKKYNDYILQVRKENMLRSAEQAETFAEMYGKGSWAGMAKTTEAINWRYKASLL